MAGTRRLNGRLAVGSAAVLIACLLPAGPATVAREPTTSETGPMGLRYDASGPCGPAAFEVATTGMCSHGPDPVPSEIRERGAPRVAAAADGGNALAAAAVGCDGDGVSGRRVQAVYAYVAGRSNRISTWRSSMRGWAAYVDSMFDNSAAETEGTARLRWVTRNCLLDIVAVAVRAASETDFGAMIYDLDRLGLNRSDRKYLVWMDSNPSVSGICGVSTIWNDDQPGLANANNQLTSYARVDYACWDFGESHELMHSLGGVQLSAPHSSGGWHCTDENDQMCYPDGPSAVMSYPCREPNASNLFDCGHDDYFHTSPAVDSYLATHWNVARSGWLVGGETADDDLVAPVAEAPHVSLAAGHTIGSTIVATVAWPAAVDDSGIASYQLQRRRGAGSWTNVPLSSPRDLATEVALVVGDSYAFRVRATDLAANTGPWSAATTASVTKLEENNTSLVYAGAWKRKALTGASGGYVRKSATAGASVTLSFTGRSVALVSTLAANRGIVQIRVDGGTWQEVDLYAPSTRTRHVAWAASVRDGNHTVEIVATATRNPAATAARVDVDAILTR